MENDILSIFRAIAAAVFFSALYAGYLMLKNFEKLFGVDPNIPSENSSARAYSMIQIFVIWAHVVVASAAFALLLH